MEAEEHLSRRTCRQSKNVAIAKRFPVLFEQAPFCETEADGNALKQSAHATIATNGVGRCADCFVAIPPFNARVSLQSRGAAEKLLAMAVECYGADVTGPALYLWNPSCNRPPPNSLIPLPFPVA